MELLIEDTKKKPTPLLREQLIHFGEKEGIGEGSNTMDFTEKDVKAVASNRYWRAKMKWRIFSGLVALLIVDLLMITLIPEPWHFFGLAPPVGLVIWLMVLSREEEKYKKELVKSWKEEANA